MRERGVVPLLSVGGESESEFQRRKGKERRTMNKSLKQTRNEDIKK